MFRLPARLLLVIALCVSLGTHWFALQSFAWARMLLQNSRQYSLTDAVARTFDGDHPCNLCKTVQHSKKQSDQQQKETATKKMDLRAVIAASDLVFPAGKFSLRKVASPQFGRRADRPPVPPPRFTLS